MTNQVRNIYYDSHEALTFGQTGVLGGVLGTTMSTIAATTVSIAVMFFGIRGDDLVSLGSCFILGIGGLFQGSSRYIVHYSLKDQLDTPAKKVLGLALEFFASAVVFGLTLSPTISAALTFSAITFPISILANILIGQAIIGIKSAWNRTT